MTVRSFIGWCMVYITVTGLLCFLWVSGGLMAVVVTFAVGAVLAAWLAVAGYLIM